MRRTFKYILLVLILTGINFTYAALAQVNSGDGLIRRPQVKYESSGLRDPFRSCLIKEGIDSGAKNASNLVQSRINLDTLVVQGIIWGGNFPQAIINNKVLAVGDLIEGAKILNIEKSGITLNFSGEIVTLAAPGKSSKIEKMDNNISR